MGELETQDADYYTASSAIKSEALRQYFDATQKTTAMPDVCYDKCKAAVDAVVSADTTDICEGATLKNALSCLEEIGMEACSTSVFSNAHSGECDGADNDTTVRTLEESGDAVELLVNETPRAVSETRNLNAYAKCYKKWRNKTPIPNGAYRATPTDKGLAECVRFDFKLWSGDFILEIGWMRIAAAFAFWMKLALCIDLGILWGIPKPLYAALVEGSTSNSPLLAHRPRVSTSPEVLTWYSKSDWISGSAGSSSPPLNSVSRPVSAGPRSPHTAGGTTTMDGAAAAAGGLAAAAAGARATSEVTATSMSKVTLNLPSQSSRPDLNSSTGARTKSSRSGSDSMPGSGSGGKLTL